MAVQKKEIVTRTLWTIDCDCGQHNEWAENPPRETRCACGKWNIPKETSFTSEEYKK